MHQENNTDNVILIQFKPKYEDLLEELGITININIAEKFVNQLQHNYPDCYGQHCGNFIFTGFKLIKE